MRINLLGGIYVVCVGYFNQFTIVTITSTFLQTLTFKLPCKTCKISKTLY